ncbi:MAG: aminopeptidase N [Alphaproteobacteria bacterium]
MADAGTPIRPEESKTKYRKDYQPPEWLIDKVDLHFELDDSNTVVKSKLKVKKNHEGAERALWLDGDELTLKEVKVNGKVLGAGDFVESDKGLSIPGVKDGDVVEITNTINPSENTTLEGLYVSNGTFCTQCESEGFRRITYYPDRPDVMAPFTVSIEADKKRFPQIMSNGNPVESRDLPYGKHFAKWDDPFPKSPYLFALVGGDMDHIENEFTTMSGRKVKLGMYVDKGNKSRGVFALEALKRSMKWDEERYGREYELDVFNVVAVDDFNFGAMENTGLNIFNSSVALADPKTATDTNYFNVERVIAHEYFHNWSGNRVTLQDWFQLTLKEGFTVLRDQQYMADQCGGDVPRIDDVITMRTAQFTEDAGPMAHPIRPDSYESINNFYTGTVYKKGAEVLRMIETLIGREDFRKGSDLYFSRFEGKAVTCEDFIKSMEEASGKDLTQFRLWYSQAGTPDVSATGTYDAATKTYRLKLKQSIPDTPGQTNKKAMQIPVRMGLIGADGKDIPLTLDGEAKPGDTTRVIELKNGEQEFVFTGVESEPVPSLFRGWSAPVKLDMPLTDEQLRFRMKHDSDTFNRWDAGQELALREMKRLVADQQAGKALRMDASFSKAFGDALSDADMDDAFKAKMIGLPAHAYVSGTYDEVDVDALVAVRKYMRGQLAKDHKRALRGIVNARPVSVPFSTAPAAAGTRDLRNKALGYMMEDAGFRTTRQVYRQYRESSNMTDRLAAMALLADSNSRYRSRALDDFYREFKDDSLTINKWYGVQVGAISRDALSELKDLMKDDTFKWTNPNRIRAAIGGFAANPGKFHAADGSGYDFLADAVIKMDGINPHVSASLIGPLKMWKRFTPDRQKLMKKALEKIAAAPDLSANTAEVVSKSLALADKPKADAAPAAKKDDEPKAPPPAM